MSLTASKAKYHAGFDPLLPGVYHAPYGKVSDLRWFAWRTGKMWAVELWGVVPDILLTAKGIGSGMPVGGMPIGGMLAKAELMEAWGPGARCSTYGGNPIACAAALATIELLETTWRAHTRPQGGRSATSAGSSCGCPLNRPT